MFITIEINSGRKWCGRCRHRDIRHGYCMLFNKCLCEPKNPKRLPDCLSASEEYMEMLMEGWS